MAIVVVITEDGEEITFDNNKKEQELVELLKSLFGGVEILPPFSEVDNGNDSRRGSRF